MSACYGKANSRGRPSIPRDRVGGADPPGPVVRAEHARDINEADLSYPIILSPDGKVLDGWHRICKAFLQGTEELDAVQLTTMPPYRWRVLLSGEEVEILEASEGSHEVT